VRIVAFLSHPIQYFSPLWAELSARPGVELLVCYYSAQGARAQFDPGFGQAVAWNIDLLDRHDHMFLPRQWPTRDPLDSRPQAINSGIVEVLRRGWDAAFINGYVHANNWLVLAACRQLGIPVMCFADSNPQTERGKPRSRLLAKRAFLSLVLPRITAFLAAGGQTRKYFEHYGVRPESIFISPYAVDVARFRSTVADAGPARIAALRASWGVPGGKRVVMFCGKLVPWKRPFDLVDAVERLQRDDCVAVFVGAGELREAIERRASPRVRLAGFINQAEIPLALAAADVLVLPSEVEPYGMVVSEALVLGIPAIASDACGCHGRESALQHGVSGFVYPTGDVAALAGYISQLLDDPAVMAAQRAGAARCGDTQSQIRAADGLLAAAEYCRRAASRRTSLRHE
jgi:glycosyltransferase involved in cell wall biosynthesis